MPDIYHYTPTTAPAVVDFSGKWPYYFPFFYSEKSTLVKPVYMTYYWNPRQPYYGRQYRK